MPDARCLRCATRVPWVSLSGNSGLALYKMVLGILGGSSALFVDGTHSLADVVGSTGIVIASRISRRPPDEDHPYGHGKAEFVGAVVVYVILLTFSCGIVVGAAYLTVCGRVGRPHAITLLGAVVSVLVNYVMYLYGYCAGTRCGSPALMADAFENRADALSSLAAVVGIAAALLIHPICDPIAAIFVGLVILGNSLVQLRDALGNLADRALPPEVTEAIGAVVRREPAVRGVDFVRTRRTGPRYWVDVGIQLSAPLPVSGADAVVARIRAEIMRRCEDFQHVEVFVVPWPARLPGSGPLRPEAAGEPGQAETGRAAPPRPGDLDRLVR
ncbi:MAG: cation transporter [Deltaproteobacteria bacterium]|nr:cation transporter [Deltaproteobacteria bacterium]